LLCGLSNYFALQVHSYGGLFLQFEVGNVFIMQIRHLRGFVTLAMIVGVIWQSLPPASHVQSATPTDSPCSTLGKVTFESDSYPYTMTPYGTVGHGGNPGNTMESTKTYSPSFDNLAYGMTAAATIPVGGGSLQQVTLDYYYDTESAASPLGIQITLYGGAAGTTQLAQYTTGGNAPSAVQHPRQWNSQTFSFAQVDGVNSIIVAATVSGTQQSDLHTVRLDNVVLCGNPCPALGTVTFDAGSYPYNTTAYGRPDSSGNPGNALISRTPYSPSFDNPPLKFGLSTAVNIPTNGATVTQIALDYFFDAGTSATPLAVQVALFNQTTQLASFLTGSTFRAAPQKPRQWNTLIIPFSAISNVTSVILTVTISGNVQSDLKEVRLDNISFCGISPTVATLSTDSAIGTPTAVNSSEGVKHP
jgi:hypothetical protein